MASFLVVSSGSHGSSGQDGSSGNSGQDGSDGWHGQSGASARPVTVTLGFADDENGGEAVIGETSTGQMVSHSVAPSKLGDSSIGIAAKGGNGGHGGEYMCFGGVASSYSAFLSRPHTSTHNA